MGDVRVPHPHPSPPLEGEGIHRGRGGPTEQSEEPFFFVVSLCSRFFSAFSVVQDSEVVLRTTAAPAPEVRRAVAAAVVGNVLEWYDFAVYAYMATVIAKKFFPAGDDVTSLLSTFAAFGLGFVARPLGGVIIGRLGDLKGRKSSLLLTIVLMAGGTVAIGLVPTFETIGIVAPALVVLARLVQGFSAGGEWGRLDSVHRRVGAARAPRALWQPPAMQRRHRAAAGLGSGRAREHGAVGRGRR
jgi:nitrate/nitrite transporter NarK